MRNIITPISGQGNWGPGKLPCSRSHSSGARPLTHYTKLCLILGSQGNALRCLSHLLSLTQCNLLFFPLGTYGCSWGFIQFSKINETLLSTCLVKIRASSTCWWESGLFSLPRMRCTDAGHSLEHPWTIMEVGVVVHWVLNDLLSVLPI